MIKSAYLTFSSMGHWALSLFSASSLPIPSLFMRTLDLYMLGDVDKDCFVKEVLEVILKEERYIHLNNGLRSSSAMIFRRSIKAGGSGDG